MPRPQPMQKPQRGPQPKQLNRLPKSKQSRRLAVKPETTSRPERTPKPKQVPRSKQGLAAMP
ncbi:hypothetical protein WI93_12805 [Burkholderia vietnamiensis]|nr:hypothetical protein WI93_12805 [Burkholderia vietnamiensis]